MVGASIVFPLIALLSLAALVVVAMAYFRGGEEPAALQRHFLLRFYVYVMLFVASVVLLIGGGQLLKAGLTFPFGMSFSYRGEPVHAEVERAPAEPPVAPVDIEDIRYREEERTRDLFTGAAFMVVGGVFFVVHRRFRRRLESPDEQQQSFLHKGYLMISGIVFGGLALVLVPVGISEAVEYWVIAYPETDLRFWQRPMPGGTLGYAIVALAMWLALLPSLFKTLVASEGRESA